MASKKPSTRPDFATLGGLLLAAGCILGGLVIEGGKLTDIAQVTALMIVLGGTIGAVMVTTPLKTLIRAAKYLGNVFFEEEEDPQEVIEEIIAYATKARKNSIMSLEADLPNIADPFLRKALSLSVDGTDLQELRAMMELDLAMRQRGGEAIAKVY
jgi:chemotaxis protein MotA